jgi:hypothetical protein
VKDSELKLKKLCEDFARESVVAKLITRRETLERWIRESLSHVISVVEAEKCRARRAGTRDGV